MKLYHESCMAQKTHFKNLLENGLSVNTLCKVPVVVDALPLGDGLSKA